MNKTALIIITIGLVIGIGIIFVGGSKNNNNNNTNTNNTSVDSVQNTEIKDGIQYITINAKGGYSPRISSGKAGIPTKLIVKTNGTYDCSAALSVKSAGFQKILKNTGEEIIDLGTPKAGVPIRGVCGMGMYSFQDCSFRPLRHASVIYITLFLSFFQVLNCKTKTDREVCFCRLF